MTLGSLAISELNYNPHEPTDAERAVNVDLDPNDFEFIELLNFGPDSIDLTGVRFVSGIEFQFPPGITLAPGDTVVIVKNMTAFQLRYGTDPVVVGQFSGNLRNNGEQIILENDFFGPILDFQYSDRDLWPGGADGNGSSLELIDPDGDYNDGTNWRPSSEYGGSPGRAGSGPVADVVINEVLTRGRPANGRHRVVQSHGPAD